MIEFSLFKPKAQQLAGLDISSSSVKMVELSEGGKGKYRVERYVIEPLPRDAVVNGNIANLEAVSDSIKRALRRFGSGIKNVAVALPAASVITKKLILPARLKETEMEMHVESEANQYIPFPLDEVNLDFQVIGPTKAEGDEEEVLVVASRKDKVEDRVAVAQAAGLKAVIVDVESFALEAAFSLVSKRLPSHGEDKIVALIEIGAAATNVSVMRDSTQVYSREQAFGGNQLTQDIVRQYGMSYEEAELAKRANSLPEGYEQELVHPFMDNIALEVSRALQFFFTSTQYSRVDHIVLAGGCAILPGLAEVVHGRTQVDTLVANPFVGMETSSRVRSKNLASDAPSLIIACGLALRRFDT